MIDLATLVPEFAAKMRAVLADCAAQGLAMRPYFGLRDPVTQGALWRQSRTASAVERQIATLRAEGCAYLADCIEQAGPHDGPWATNALPGMSWHQHGEAVDSVAVSPDGSFDWSTAAKYQHFGSVAESHGLRWGGRFGDPGHVQLRLQEVPQVYSDFRAIDAAMQARWCAVKETA